MINDYCVVGAGVVGMATAMSLVRSRPGASVVVLEKEPAPAQHQSGHNSGVIHSGVYYEPGSLKARLCVRGVRMTKDFCAEHGIPVLECGKVIVATSPLEDVRLQRLAERATANGVEAQSLSATQLRELEPNVQGVSALLVPSTGVVDYRQVVQAMETVVRAAGGRVEYGVEVTAISESAEAVRVVAGERSWSCRQLVVCGGMQSDRLVRAAGMQPQFRIVPFRGEYYRLAERHGQFINHLVYPVPDPALPFLGVHLTRTTSGAITVGPNAVLGLSREGYPRGSVTFPDVRDFLAYAGFWRFARGYLRAGARELRNSMWKKGYLRECQKYAPSLQADDLIRDTAGIRAQAVLPDGTLVHDFLFEATPRTLHVCNAPSPAATSAIPIAQEIVQRVHQQEAGRE
ncbi:MAG TPA: L-2-hydroxyglutarate oxidase [Jatrophihabitans sp.]|nr:L-2-hydroxyglutarate oxidase [Jatrophihabitans sp.]